MVETAADGAVVGVDGCPGGWVAVTWWPEVAKRAPQVMLHEAFSGLLKAHVAERAIGVDMPIGLPNVSRIGGRGCEVAARRVLGQRQSAVFSVPARAAVMETDYRAACQVALAHSDPPRKVSKQCFHLFPKIREIDALMTPALQTRVFECHPEVVFAGLNGWVPLDLAKKIKGRVNPEGLVLREQLLRSAGFDLSQLERPAWPKRLVGADDIVDAAACAVGAARFARGVARCFTGPNGTTEVDAKGLAIAIWG